MLDEGLYFRRPAALPPDLRCRGKRGTLLDEEGPRGWVVRLEYWSNLQHLPVPLRHLQKLSPRLLLSIRPPPKPPQFYGYNIFDPRLCL
ncbi:hypothetical protein V6N13_008742 [Hibiscus sabdariffa]|uniref:Uncharacterized protein n=1 Tax=Hibiscus sabdariffa TaxID=183260 RepID=A0ABR2ECT2_9ROSI